MQTIDKLFSLISRWLHYISAFCIAAMMFLITVDIILRFLFSSPVQGSYEIIELMMAVLVFFAFSQTQRNKGHVKVTLFVDKLPTKAKYICDSAVLFLSAVMAGLVAYASFLQASATTAKTSVLYLPTYPVMYLMGVAAAVFTIVLLLDSINSLLNLNRRP